MDVEILEDGRIVISGQQQLLAGSSLETDVCVANAISMASISLKDALDMAGRNPARLLGFEEVRLRRGSRADLIVYDFPGPGNPLKIRATVSAGELRFGSLDNHGSSEDV